MTVLSGEAIGYLIVRNGKFGPGGDKAKIIAFLDTAIAVALAESGGDTNVTHTNKNGSIDYGLWQINSVHDDLISRGNWRDPGHNTEMARSVWAGAGNSFSPWSTYKSGAYKAFLGHGEKVYNAAMDEKKTGTDASWRKVLGIALVGPIGTLLHLDDNAADAVVAVAKGPGAVVAGALKDVFTWLAKGAIVIGATLLALLLLGLGIWLIISTTKTGKEIGGAAKDAGKAGLMAAVPEAAPAIAAS